MFSPMVQALPAMAFAPQQTLASVVTPFQDAWGYLSRLMQLGGVQHVLSNSLPTVSTLRQAMQRANWSAPPELAPLFAEAAQRYNLPQEFLESVAHQESRFRPDATSQAGAQGIMQLMPRTAQSLGVTNPYDPAQSIDAGARYLRQQLNRFNGDYRLALAAYNAGAGNVRRYNGIPPFPETQNYVQNIMGRLGQ